MIAPDGAGGTIEATEGAEVEVYFRPPSSYLDPESLATVLRRRLRRQAESEAPSGVVVESDGPSGVAGVPDSQ